MCTVLLPPGDKPIAVNKYINIYQIYVHCTYTQLISSIVKAGIIIKQHRRCSYNVTLRRVRATIFDVHKQ